MADFFASDPASNLINSGTSHPNPAFRFLTGFLPRKLKDLFKWSEYLYYSSAHIQAALNKLALYAVTSVTFKTSNNALRKNYTRLFEKSLHVKQHLALANINRRTYGNEFVSLIQPFVRYLRCGHPKCEQLTQIDQVEYKFKLATLEFKYTCRACKQPSVGKIVDKRIRMPVVEAFVKYVKPAKLDDLLEVSSRVSGRKKVSFTFSYEIRNEAGELVATGFTRHACWDPATARVIALPDWLKEIMPDADLDPTDR